MERMNLLDVLNFRCFPRYFCQPFCSKGWRGNATLTMIFVRVLVLFFCSQNSTRYITQVFVKTFSLKKSTIIWMCLELERTLYSTSLIAPLNASAIPPVYLWTWLLPKELTESFGASYFLLWSTTTLTSTKETTLHTTFPSRYKGVKCRQTLPLSF